jgi:hypothetical protein
MQIPGSTKPMFAVVPYPLEAAISSEGVAALILQLDRRQMTGLGHERRFPDLRDESGPPPTPETLRQRGEPTLRANALNRFAIDSRKVSLICESGKQDIDRR